MTIAWLLIAVFVSLIPPSVIVATDHAYERSCKERNAQMIDEDREGPLEECKGLY